MFNKFFRKMKLNLIKKDDVASHPDANMLIHTKSKSYLEIPDNFTKYEVPPKIGDVQDCASYLLPNMKALKLPKNDADISRGETVRLSFLTKKAAIQEAKKWEHALVVPGGIYPMISTTKKMTWYVHIILFKAPRSQI